MKRTYSILGLVLCLHGEWLNDMPGIGLFQCADSDMPDLELHASPVDALAMDDQAVFDGMVSYSSDSQGLVFSLNAPKQMCYARIRIDSSLRTGHLSYRESGFPQGPGGAVLLLEHVFRMKMLLHDGIFLHSAAIAYRGGAILFTAPSGTGKTTQAQLWKTERGAVVINGDRPALFPSGTTWLACGTPWSGSSGDHTTLRVPVRCIVVVNRSNINSLQEARRETIPALLLPRFFLPYASPDGMEQALSLAEKVCEQVPVFLLHCRPDKEAVDVLWEGIRHLWDNKPLLC